MLKNGKEIESQSERARKKSQTHTHMPITFFTVDQWANCDVLSANSVLNSQWSRFRRLFLLLKCTVPSTDVLLICLRLIFFLCSFFLVLFYNELWTGLNETRYHHTYAKCVHVLLHFELAHFSFFSMQKKNFDFHSKKSPFCNDHKNKTWTTQIAQVIGEDTLV